MLDGVVQQVQEHLPQKSFVSVKRCLRGRFDYDIYPLTGGQHICRTRRLQDQFVQIEVAGSEGLSAYVCAGEREHILDNAREAARLLVYNLERVSILTLAAPVPLKRHVRRGSHHREWSAQLVRGVG